MEYKFPIGSRVVCPSLPELGVGEVKSVTGFLYYSILWEGRHLHPYKDQLYGSMEETLKSYDSGLDVMLKIAFG